ncbi:YdcF family protein [Dyadobacter bucti]|uniref:YdcF family protein n=1 Tax=Dyadobacter bucti TaxID=2572203 RepID=UPI001107DCE4|nr:YdcF family protein [Dyadobacter bucti]
MSRLPILLLLCAVALTGRAQSIKPVASYKFINGNPTIASKNFYLLTLLGNLPGSKILLENDPQFAALTKQRADSLDYAVKNCKDGYECFSGKMKFTAEQIAVIGNHLRELYSDKNELGKLVKEHLIPSGTYILFKEASPADLLKKAWEQDAAAVNHIIELYAEGKKPNYPAIDSISFKTRAKSFPILMYDCAEVVKQEHGGTKMFFDLPLHFALQVMEASGRNEAGDYEPMVSTVNKAAYDQVKTIKWDQFTYTLILVPGAGPDTYDVALSAGGMLRCRIAALRYFEGMAPFIVVSGGRVHPYKTKYSEAFEMKKFLIESLKVPEHAIIMDPHARHTTTNMRNAVRLLFRYGMPVDKPSLVSTVRSQSYYITNDAFAERCRKEINHVPYKLGKRLSETDFEFYPVLDALHIDADEPLDP